MNDLDRTIRAALDAAGERAVAPPFDRVRRRHARTRTRRVSALAVASVVAVATAALAAPGGSGEGRGGHLASQAELRPWHEVTDDPYTLMKVSECAQSLSTYRPPAGGFAHQPLVTAEDIATCYARFGFEAPPAGVTGAFPVAVTPTEDPPTGQEACPFGAQERTIAAGTDGGEAWRVVVWPGTNGTWCSSWRTKSAPNTQMHGDDTDDFGRVGSLFPRLHWTPLSDDQTVRSEYVVVWGALTPDVARVRFTSTAGVHTVDTVAVPGQTDRVYVGAAFLVGNAGWNAAYLDSAGKQIGRYPPLP